MADLAKLEVVSIDKLIPYINNANKHSSEQITKLAASIREFGFISPALIDSNYNLIAGHGRIEAAKKAGLTEVPCVFVDGLTEAQRKAYILADNRLSEFAEWDMELVASELEMLDELDFDIDLTGFELTDTSKSTVDDDFDFELPEAPKSKQGGLYQLGRHRLMCGDSTNAGDVAILMGEATADMLLTDPPYNVDYEGSAGKIKNDRMKDTEFRQFLTDAFKAAYEVMKPGAAFHIWHADAEGYNFRGACKDAGLRVRQCLIWVKDSLVLGRQDFQWRHEPCLYGEKELAAMLTEEFVPADEFEDEENHMPCLYGWKDGKHYWFKNRKQTTVLEFDRPKKSAEHPTMKPVRLFDYEIRCNTKPGQNVLDLFAGSGTTIIACEQNERNAFCMEYDPKYVDVIIERWEEFTGERAVLIND